MFTKWYKMIQRGLINYTSVTGMKNISGATFNYSVLGGHSNNVYDLALGYALRRALLEDNMPGSGYPCVSFGSGSTPPTEEDYRLSFLQGVTYAAGSVSTKYGDSNDVIENTFMITNKNEEEITVSEAGIFVPVMYGNGGNKHYTMVNRIVFDNPVTIQAGDSATVKYTVSVNYPE